MTTNTDIIPIASRVVCTTIPCDRLVMIAGQSIMTTHDSFDDDKLRSHGIEEIIINRNTNTYTIWWW